MAKIELLTLEFKKDSEMKVSGEAINDTPLAPPRILITLEQTGKPKYLGELSLEDANELLTNLLDLVLEAEKLPLKQ